MIELGPEADHSLLFLGELQHEGVTITKTGYNSFGGYSYATLDDILDAIQPTLGKHNCIVVWSETDHEHSREQIETEKGVDYYMHTDSILLCRIMRVDNPSDYIETQSHGYGINKNADKTCKATTIGKRYALINLLGIKAVNDEDTDNPAFDVNKSSRGDSSMGDAAKAFKRRQRNTRSVEQKRSDSNMII